MIEDVDGAVRIIGTEARVGVAPNGVASKEVEMEAILMPVDQFPVIQDNPPFGLVSGEPSGNEPPASR